MLHPFISAPQPRPSSAPLLALCASVHVGLLCAALWATGMVRPVRLIEPAVERVRFAELPVSTLRRAAARRVRGHATGSPVHVARELAPPSPPLLAAFDLVLPELPPLPDFQPRYAELDIGQGVGSANDVLHLGLRPAAPQPAADARYSAYAEDAVDRLASPAATNTKPRYPSRMRERGVETSFVVYFVVDSSGTVDRATVELPSSIEVDFTTAVAEALARWRFVPAEVLGRRVRQHSRERFTFQIVERYSSRDD